MDARADEQEMAAAADFLRLKIPEECLPGVAFNLGLLKQHSEVLEAFLKTQDDEA